MKYSLCTVLVGAITSASVFAAPTSEGSDLARRDDHWGGCMRGNQDIITRRHMTGANNRGTYDCASDWNYGVLPNRIYARASGRMVRWLKIGYTDGSSREYGTDPGIDSHNREGTVEWDPYSQRLGRFSTWDGGYKGALARMVIEVEGCDGDRCKMDVGGHQRNNHEWNIPMGDRGALLGFELTHGDGIDSLTPLFSKSAIERAELVNMKTEVNFEELVNKPFGENGMTGYYITQDFDLSESSATSSSTFEAGLEVVESTKVSVVNEDGKETGFEFGVNLSGEMGVGPGSPKNGKVGAEASFKYSEKTIKKTIKTEEDSKDKKKIARYTLQVNAPARVWTYCYATVIQSEIKTDYTADLRMHFKNGDSFDYRVKGRIENSDYSAASTRCEDIIDGKVPEFPQGYKDIRIRNKREVEDGEAFDIEKGNFVGGTFCPDGRKVGSIGMSDKDYYEACGYEWYD